MKTLADQLLDMLNALQAAPGVSSAALRNLLRTHAAEVIQQDPASATVPPGVDPLIEEAIHAGAEQANQLNQAGVRIRLAVVDFPLGTVAADAGESPSETFGPFVEQSGRLLHFVSFVSSSFISVKVSWRRPRSRANFNCSSLPHPLRIPRIRKRGRSPQEPCGFKLDSLSRELRD